MAAGASACWMPPPHAASAASSVIPLAASKAAVRGDDAAFTRAAALVEAGAPAAARGTARLCQCVVLACGDVEKFTTFLSLCRASLSRLFSLLCA
jgi:hypothetical protein